ncbi:MAG: hypothetical protein HQK58_06800 [Deltaproteobacteria bacterium]|nr:hypothetical protein [Deltaproteobacteria bacterium]
MISSMARKSEIIELSEGRSYAVLCDWIKDLCPRTSTRGPGKEGEEAEDWSVGPEQDTGPRRRKWLAAPGG